MKYSDVLNLNLPESTDKYNVDDFNENFKILDVQGQVTKDQGDSITALQETVATQSSLITSLANTLTTVASQVAELLALKTMLITRKVSTSLVNESGEAIVTRDGSEIELYFTLKAE